MAQPMPPPGQGPMPFGPGQQPTPEQIRQMQQKIAEEAQKAGMPPQQYVEMMRQRAMQQMMAQRQAAAQQGGPGAPGAPGGPAGPGGPGRPPMAQGGAQPGQQVPIQPGPPKPEAILLAKFLQSQNLKPRTCIFQEKRKDMFKVKRAIRALHTDAYKKFRAKNPGLPEVTDRTTAENCFKLLPMSLLALRVSKIDPHEGHNHAKKKRVKGLWTVKIEQQQEARDDYHYVWLYEGAQWKTKLYAAGALFVILAIVFFPVWPYHLRLGVWYLSMGSLGLLGLFFGLAIVRLILFIITMFTHPPGLWLYPNLFEDVGFFDSFKPIWAWHEDEKTIKRKKKQERDRKRTKREAKAKERAEGAQEGTSEQAAPAPTQPAAALPQSAAATSEASAATSGAQSSESNSIVQRNLHAQVEEVEDE